MTDADSGPASPLKLHAACPSVDDETLARSLRGAAQALIDAIPDKIEDAPLSQVAGALKTAVELVRMLEAPYDAREEQVIRWEFVYDGAVHDAPPWAAGRAVTPGAVPRGGVRAAVGQD
ncbi:MAG: hypothetical protein JW910_17645 [Anaerolineae bacterium]|nr:hypothetical protein [Anaerolineae bacterium]